MKSKTKEDFRTAAMLLFTLYKNITLTSFAYSSKTYYVISRPQIRCPPCSGTQRVRPPPLSFFLSPSLFYLLVHSRCRGFLWFHLITIKHTPQSVGLLWTRDRPVAETSTWQHKHSQQTNIHDPGGIRNHDPWKRSPADLRLRPRGHWDRPPPL
jgi:hypothetical protein